MYEREGGSRFKEEKKRNGERSSKDEERALQLTEGQPLSPNHKGLKWLIVVGLASVQCWAPLLSPLWPKPAPVWPGQASTVVLEPTRRHSPDQTAGERKQSSAHPSVRPS